MCEYINYQYKIALVYRFIPLFEKYRNDEYNYIKSIIECHAFLLSIIETQTNDTDLIDKLYYFFVNKFI